MAIQVRRGKESDLVRSKLLPGEFALSTDTKKLRICTLSGEVIEFATVQDLQTILEMSGDEYKAFEELLEALQDESVLQSILTDLTDLKDVVTVGEIDDMFS